MRGFPEWIWPVAGRSIRTTDHPTLQAAVSFFLALASTPEAGVGGFEARSSFGNSFGPGWRPPNGSFRSFLSSLLLISASTRFAPPQFLIRYFGVVPRLRVAGGGFGALALVQSDELISRLVERADRTSSAAKRSERWKKFLVTSSVLAPSSKVRSP